MEFLALSSMIEAKPVPVQGVNILKKESMVSILYKRRVKDKG
jgi:hypothetical protein